MRIYCEKDYNAMSRRAAAIIAALGEVKESRGGMERESKINGIL